MNKIISKVIVVLLVPVSLTLIYVAGSWGMADIYYRPALNEIRSWIFGESEIHDEQWDRLRLNLNRAQQLDPSNPYIYENLAIAYEGQFSKVVVGEVEAESFRKTALAHYRTSALLRPTWPYVWNSIMLTKFHLGHTDEEFLKAFHNQEHHFLRI